MLRSIALALCFVGGATAQGSEEHVDLVQRGLAALGAEDFERAAELLGAAHALDPAHAQVARGLAAAHVRVGSRLRDDGLLRDALARFERADGLWPDQVEIVLGLGTILARLGEPRAAEQRLLAALELAPSDGRVLASLAQLAEDQDRIERAADLWNRASAASPDHEEYRERAARAGRHLEVERSYRTLSHGVFRLRYPPGRDAGVEAAVPVVRTWLSAALRDLRRDLGRMPVEPITIVMYPKGQYRAVSTARHWAVAYFDGKVRLDFGEWQSRRDALRETLRHELAHAFLNTFHPGLPTWMHEGYAQLVGGRALAVARSIVRTRRATDLDSVLSGAFAESDDRTVAERGYALSLLIVADLRSRRTPREFGRLLEALARGEDSEAAVERCYGLAIKELVVATAPIR